MRYVIITENGNMLIPTTIEGVYKSRQIQDSADVENAAIFTDKERAQRLADKTPGTWYVRDADRLIERLRIYAEHVTFFGG